MAASTIPLSPELRDKYKESIKKVIREVPFSRSDAAYQIGISDPHLSLLLNNKERLWSVLTHNKFKKFLRKYGIELEPNNIKLVE